MSELGETFSWVELYEGGAGTDALRRKIGEQLASIAEGTARIAAALEGGQVANGTDPDDNRAELAHVLANLNSAELHVSDYTGS